MPYRVLLVMQAPRRKRLFINSLPPLGILSIASSLKSRGIPVKVRDCYIDTLTADDMAGADIIGLSVNMANVEESLRTAAHIKKTWPGKKVILGGPLCMSLPERVVRQQGVDAVAVCEGEELMCGLASGKPLHEVKGLYLKDEGGKAFFTGPREWIADLDRLPFPALDMVDLNRYYSPVKKATPVSTILTSRGCPYNCIFCLKSTGRVWRARLPEHVVDELEWQVKDLGAREICIYDENFTMDIPRAEEICRRIISRKIRVSLQLTNGIRADRLTRGAVSLLKEAGVWIIGVAPETGNRETLEKICKEFDLEKVAEAVRWCREEGLATWAFFMVGFPWETRRHLEDTLRYAVALGADITHFARVIAFPGTRLHEMLGSAEGAGADALRDRNLFHGAAGHTLAGITERELQRFISRAHRAVYLKPGKWLRLLRMLGPGDLWRLFVYSLITGNV